MMGKLPRTSGIAFCFFFSFLLATSQALSLSRAGSAAGHGPEELFVYKAHPKHNFLKKTHHVEQSVYTVAYSSESGTVVRAPLPLNKVDTAKVVKNVQAAALGYWPLLIMSLVAWIMAVFYAAYNYKESESYFYEIGPVPEDPAKTRKTLSSWQFGWYECGNDPEVCFWSFCCPWIRWAHTMDLLHLIEYAPAFAIFFMLALVNSMTGFVLIGAYFTMLLVHYRQKLRKMFGMQNYGTVAGLVEDWLCLCFCLPCTIAQEAQHVKLAAEMGFPLPASMAVYGGIRKSLSPPEPLAFDDDSDPASSSQSFHDVQSKISGSVGDSPAMPQSSPTNVFGGIFHQARSRQGSRNSSVGGQFRNSRSRSGSREPRGSHGAKASPKPKPKALTLTPCVSGECSVLRKSDSLNSLQRGRGAWHRESQNPMPERLLAQAPIHSGEQVEVRHGRTNFVQFLSTLHDDLRAYVFLFIEVGCVGRCGTTCRTLHEYVWADRAFWQFYGGSSVNNKLAQPWACPAHALREAFRKWIFHLDGVWTKELRKFIEQARQSPSGADLSLIMSYARYIASGLMPYDSRPAVAEFTGIMCELLAEYSPEIMEERNAAEAMTAQVECMAEVFTGAQIKLTLSAFDCSLGRAVSAAPSEAAESDFPEPVYSAGAQLEPIGDDTAAPWGDNAIMWFG